MSASQIQRAIDQGNAFYAAGRFSDAVVAYRSAVALDPANPEALNNLGLALKDAGQFAEAIQIHRRAVLAAPDIPELRFNLASILSDDGIFDEAIREFEICLRERPNFEAGHRNLGNALRSVGRGNEGLNHLRWAGAASDVLYASHFLSDDDPVALYQAHRAWGNAAEPLPPMQKEPRVPASRIRVGYVSADLREHPVGRFMLPILEGHDRAQFQIVCYSDTRYEDAISQRLRQNVDIWRNTARLTDEQLAQAIDHDQIDVLIDLAMHMRGSRLGAFAWRSAPVQATYLAYCSTTGLREMDYRLSDPYLDPIGDDESVYTEKTIRLPRTYWCYPEPGPHVAGPRKLSRITFGCLNSFTKVTEPMLRAWGQLLRGVDESSLVLHCPEGSHRARAIESLGVAAERVRFVAFLPLDRYLALHSEIDIALDPFPYGGGTTSCDALWCGTPVVSLRGRTAVSRGGLSILSNIGMPELVATSMETYIQIATELAMDRPRLAHLHATLRERLRQSPLMDRKRFVVDLEAVFREMHVSRR